MIELPNGKRKNEDIFMKPVTATFGLGEKAVDTYMKGMSNLAKGFTSGFGKGLRKMR